MYSHLGKIKEVAFPFIYQAGKFIDSDRAASHINSWFLEAKIAFNEQNFTKAENAFLEIIKLEPKSISAWVNLSYLYQKQNKLAKAEQALQEAIKLKPQAPDLYLLLGRFYFECKQSYDKAEEILRNGIKHLNLEYHKIILVEYWMCLAIACEKQAKYIQAEEKMLKAIEFDNNDAYIYFTLGILYFNQEQAFQNSLEKAEKAFQTATKINPGIAVFWCYLGNVYWKQNKFLDAEKALQMCVTIKEDEEQYLIDLGYIQHFLHHYSASEVTYSKLTKLFPANAVYWHNLGTAYGGQVKNKKAKDAYSEALKLDDKYAAAWYHLGLTNFKLNDYQTAEENYLKAIMLENNNEHYLDELYDFYFQTIPMCREEAKNQWQKAKEILQKLLQINPSQMEYWYRFGDVCYELEQWEDAERAYKKVVEIIADDKLTSALLLRLAYVCYKRGNKEKKEKYELAETYQLKAKDIDKNDPKCWLALGCTYYQLDKLQDAESALNKAKELGTKEDDLWKFLINIYNKQNNYSKIESVCLESLQIFPNDSFYWRSLAEACFNQGLTEKSQYKKAKKYFKKALTIYSDDNLSIIGLVRSYFVLDKFKKALKFLQKAKELENLPANHLLEFAEIFAKNSEYSSSIKFYLDALKKAPERNTEINLKIAQVYFIAKHYIESQAYYQKVLDAIPNYYEALLGKANSLREQLEYETALAIYKILIEGNNFDANVLYEMGFTCQKMGRLRDALVYLERAQICRPNYEFVLKLLIQVHTALGNTNDIIKYSELINQTKGILPTINVGAANSNQLLLSLHAILNTNFQQKDLCLQLLSEALNKGADINAVDDNGNNLLHRAIQLKIFWLIPLLNQFNISLNSLNKEGYSPLHVAVLQNNQDAVEQLLACCTSLEINLIDNFGFAPIHYAAENGAKVIILLLKKANANVNILTTNNKKTALYIAIDLKKYLVAVQLLQLGADSNLTDDNGTSCLHLAYRQNAQDIFSELIISGANLSQKDSQSTVFHLAVSENNLSKFKTYLELVKKLTRDYKDILKQVFASKNSQGKTSLDLAFNLKLNEPLLEWIKLHLEYGAKVYSHHVELATDKGLLIFSYLLENAQKSGIGILTKEEYIQIFKMVVWKGEVDLLNIVIKYKDKFLQKRQDFFAILAEAVTKNKLKMLEELAKNPSFRQVFVEKIEQEEQTLMHLAVSAQVNESIYPIIVQNIPQGLLKTWINAKNMAGETALHIAIRQQNDSGLCWLLKQLTIDVNQPTSKNAEKTGERTPLHYASIYENKFAVTILCQHKVVRYAMRDQSRYFPLFFAAKNRDIRRQLKNKGYDYFISQIRTYIKANISKNLKEPDLWLEHIKLAFLKKDERLTKLKQTILNYPPEIILRVATFLGKNLVNNLNKILSSDYNSNVYQTAFAEKNYEFIYDDLVQLIAGIYSQYDLGIMQTNDSELSIVVEKSGGFYLPARHIKELKERAFKNALMEVLEYQFYISKGILEKLVERKADNFDTAADLIKDVSPFVQQQLGMGFKSALALTLINLTFSFIKSIKDAKAESCAKNIMSNYGNVFGRIDRPKIEGLAEQLVIRFRYLIHQQSVGFDSCGALYETPDDGVVHFAIVVGQRINKHIMENKSLHELQTSAKILEFFKNAHGACTEVLEKIFLNPQDQSVRKDNLPLVERCIFASWFEDEGEDIDVKLDTKRFGERKIVKAGNLLRFTEIRLIEDNQSHWKHSSSNENWGFIYATEAEAKMRGFKEYHKETNIQNPQEIAAVKKFLVK